MQHVLLYEHVTLGLTMVVIVVALIQDYLWCDFIVIPHYVVRRRCSAVTVKVCVHYA